MSSSVSMPLIKERTLLTAITPAPAVPKDTAGFRATEKTGHALSG